MLGEQHRQRLLGLLHPVTADEARARAEAALAELGLARGGAGGADLNGESAGGGAAV
jgi:hypothetical protein